VGLVAGLCLGPAQHLQRLVDLLLHGLAHARVGHSRRSALATGVGKTAGAGGDALQPTRARNAARADALQQPRRVADDELAGAGTAAGSAVLSAARAELAAGLGGKKKKAKKRMEPSHPSCFRLP
jgi:hypothetical protein